MASPEESALNPLALAAAEGVTLENTFGAWLVCASVGCMLFGLTTHQTYRYYRLYPSDSLGFKWMVAALLVLDSLHTVSNVHLCYYYLVINYFNPAALLSGVWSLRLSITETACLMLISHSFFLRRIFLLGGRQLFPVILISTLVLSEMGFAIAVTALTFIKVTFAGFHSYMWMIWVLLGNAVLIDVLVTGFLIYYLYQSRTGFKRTDSLLDVLMVYTVNTGLSTSIITIPAMICSIIMPNNLIWSSVYVVASKMYANSLLAVLNSRRSLVDKGMEGFETGSFGLQVIEADHEIRPFSFGQTELRHRGPRSARSPNKADGRFIDVKVTTETFLDISAGESSSRHLDDRSDAEST